MLTDAGPVAAVAEALRVNVALFPVVEAGLKVAVTPLGRPWLDAAFPLLKEGY